MIKLFVARDKDGRLFLFEDKPKKIYKAWVSNPYIPIDSSLLPNVKWEDDEPTLVTLKIME